MSYLDELRKTTNKTRTENDAVTNLSTLNPVLDFFAQAGAMRGRVDDAVRLFNKAYAKEPLLALRALFYLRDIRGGQGERTLFRECIKHVPEDVMAKNIEHVAEFGRYDDLFSLDVEQIKEFIKTQLAVDEKYMGNGESVSLLAKWLPSENTSSKTTRSLAQKLAKALGLSPAKYRKRIVALRKYIILLEQKMSAKEWGEVDYEKTPSQAMRKHTKAFYRNDEQRFTKFLDAVEKGEKKINTSTVYTYEIFDLVGEDPKTANVMWKNLPDYTNGVNALVIADVSGSMEGRPMSISVSLALYFAERNEGPFKNYFMTFSEEPRMTEVLGSDLAQKLHNIETADWDMNTNIEAAFKAILAAAESNKASKDEMPKILYIISDMEFDQCIEGASSTNFENAKKMFEDAGYELPHVVFWNVDSRHDNVPALSDDQNVTLLSGSSQSSFRYAVEGKNPVEFMEEVLNSERYSVIHI